MSDKKRIYLSPPHLGASEIEYVKEAFASNWITNAGENVEAFEKSICQYTSTANAVVLQSGTAAIHLALILLGVTAGDEVICPSFTFSASANPIVYLGARPVFVDSEKETWNMSPDLLKEAIADRIKKGKKPKAIILVHLYGQVAQIEKILDLALEYQIPVIEDAAESLGSTYEGKMTGTFGKFGIYSFNGNKIITTSGGGALISEDHALIESAKFLSTQARDHAPHYQHSAIGYNYKMSNVLAGIGRGQLEVIEERIQKRRFIFEYYKTACRNISEISFLEERKNTFYNRWLTCILIDEKSKVNKEDIRLALEAENIESRPLWKPMHMQPIFEQELFYGNGVSEQLFNSGLCLPSGSAMSEEDLDRVIKTIFKVIKA